MTQAESLATAKLAASGLDLTDAARLGIEVLEPEQTAERFPKSPVPALLFRYFDTSGHERRDVFRVRLLDQPRGPFGEVPIKPLRYLQPAGSPVAVYFPRSVDWPAVLGDRSKLLLITEGELKAACACKLGFPAIGLGGVSSWRSAKRACSFLPELAAIDWSSREVAIVFDSDASTNPDVAAATAALASELRQRGARPRIATLPSPARNSDLKKTGLDDFIVSHPTPHEATVALEAVLLDADCDELSVALWEFNSRYCYVVEPGLIYDTQKDHRHNLAQWQKGACANVLARKITIDGRSGAPKLKQVHVADEWVAWPHRRQYDGLTYAPGRPQVWQNRLNSWRGFAVESKPGDVGPWQHLLDHLFTGAEPTSRQWFERWCAWPIAHPTRGKQLSAVGIWSQRQGVGKSLAGATLCRIYGDNASTINQHELEGDFNSWAANKQFVLADDVSSHDSRAKADALKKAITQTELRINIKFVPQYTIPDCVNYFLTSNRPNAFYLDDHDRRFFIHEVTAGKLPDALVTTYREWLASDGPAHLRHYFEQLDFGNFDEITRPPMTAAKEQMILSGKGELALWLHDLKADPDAGLRLGAVHFTRDLFTAAELVALFDQERKGPPVAATTLGLMAGEYFPRANGGRLLKAAGKPGRYFVVRNADRWLGASPFDLAAHIAEGCISETAAHKF